MVVWWAVVLALATALPGPLATAAPTTRVVPPSIDGTGDTDVTEALNRFFAGVPDGSVIELRPGATYRVEGTLELTERNDLVLDGRGATVFATSEGARDRSHLSIDEGAGIVVRDLVIEGAHPYGGTEDRAWRTDKAFQHGIRIRGASDVELDRVTVTDAFGDLVYVGWSEDRTWSENVWIHDSLLARNGRQGIAVTAGRNVVIERNTITDTRRATIDLEPDTPALGAVNVHILDNVIGPGKLRFIAAHGAGPVSEVVVARNDLRGRDLAIDIEPPEGERRSSFWVVDNRSDRRAGSSPLRFTRLDGVVVRGNTQPVDARRPAITADAVCGLEVDDNDFDGAAEVVSATGGACGAAVAEQVPAPPELEGRTARQPDTAAPGSTPEATATEPDAARSAGDEPDDAALQEPIPDATDDGWLPLSAAERWALVAVTMLVAIGVAQYRRRRRNRRVRRPTRAMTGARTSTGR